MHSGVRFFALLGASLAAALSAPAAGWGFSSAPGQCTASPVPMPAHGAVSPGDGEFALIPSSAVYRAGMPMTITLDHPAHSGFKGLLLYAFDLGGGHVGSFSPAPGYPAVACGGGATASLGQNSAVIKTTPVTFTRVGAGGESAVATMLIQRD